jgi:DNA-binding LacI/PurR family transcriptional regulator/signal transduction histidine kinase
MKEKTLAVQKKTFTIGLFIDWVDSPFQFQMLEGIEAGAKKRDMNLYCFVGGAIKSPSAYERARNFIYDYATEKVIDGLIIMSTPVGNFVSIDVLNQFRSQYKNIPVVSIAQTLNNTYTVKIDNTTGLKLLVNHLIKDHGYKNIAIIKGPENNMEALERFNAYKDALEENGIPFNKELAVPGLFHEQSGYDAAMLLLAKKDIRIEAIVAVNDDMAFGAIKALQERDLNVPYDIAVTGFDDQLQCRYFSPSISTVKMPIFQLGFQAVGVLDNIFNHQPVEPIIMLPTKPVIRESCGCAIHPQTELKLGNHRDPALKMKKQNEENPMVQRLFEFLYESLRLRNTGFTNDDILHFSDLFILSVKEKKTSNLINYLSMLMNKGDFRERGIEHLFQFFLNEKTGILDFFETQEEKADVDYQIQMISQHIFNYLKKNLNYNKIKLEREFIRFRTFGGELVVCSNTDQIIDTLLRVFPILDTKTFYLSLYRQEEKEPDSIKSDLRMVLAYRNREKVKIDDHASFDPYEALVPEQYLDNSERWSLIIEPIFFGSTRLGLAIFDMKIEGYIDYVMRRRVLNDALNYAVYVQRVLSQSRNLEKANSELSRTLNILKETQEKLIQSEKMSVIGNLVAGISHEINTPIGISVTAASHLDEITRNISGLYAMNNMKKSDFEKYLKTAEELSGMILNNLQKAHELIGSFKQVTVDQSTEERRIFNVKEYLDQILLSLKPALKKTDLAIEVKCPDNLELLSFPGAFYQIITNFLMNSVIHGYDKGQKGNIIIEISVENNQAMLEYADDGKGISPAIIDKIFDPFFTTKRGQGGTGLGLHVVYNIVSQKLNGSIKCTSSVGKGATFKVIFPIGK